MSFEKTPGAGQALPVGDESSDSSSSRNNVEVFAKSENQVDFRTVHWIRAGVIFLKRESAGSLRLES